jgi:hypothetical protein
MIKNGKIQNKHSPVKLAPENWFISTDSMIILAFFCKVEMSKIRKLELIHCSTYQQKMSFSTDNESCAS